MGTYTIHTVEGDTPYVEMRGTFSMDDLQSILSNMEAAYTYHGDEDVMLTMGGEGPGPDQKYKAELAAIPENEYRAMLEQNPPPDASPHKAGPKPGCLDANGKNLHVGDIVEVYGLDDDGYHADPSRDTRQRILLGVYTIVAMQPGLVGVEWPPGEDIVHWWPSFDVVWVPKHHSFPLP